MAPRRSGSTPPAWLTADEKRAWRDLVAAMGGGSPPPAAVIGLEAACCQLARMRDARRRVEAEGEIVLDARDRPVPHPSVVAERMAGAEVRKWVDILTGGAGKGDVGRPPKAVTDPLDELAARRRKATGT